LLPGCAKLSTNPAPTGSGTIANTIGTVRVVSTIAAKASGPTASITPGASPTNSAAYFRRRVGSLPPQRIVQTHIAALDPAVSLQSLAKSRHRSLSLRIVGGDAVEYAETRISSGCCACGKQPRDCRTSNSYDEIAPSHCLPQGLDHANYTLVTRGICGR
jgi:hypothetical protein